MFKVEIVLLDVQRACTELWNRLAPYRQKNPDAGWDSWIMAAYLDRVQLSATGFYATPGVSGFNFDTQEGTPFSYFSFGAAVSEVEIDCLTGDHTVLRTDIVMDVGKSLNPAVDIGQIEGALVQGQGLFTLEELRFSPRGALLTTGPGAYKLPGVQDIPCEMNVTLLREAGNPKAVYSSKAIGEPPLFLASSIFFAIKDAVAAAREDERFQHYGDEEAAIVTAGEPRQTKTVGSSARLFRLDSPATAERIRMACNDRITSLVSYPQIETHIFLLQHNIPAPVPGTFTPWDVTV
ncbi:hypothetical protein HAZT_HAZT007513 [Hyalella azteca]|uniref:Aldehyde oxidase/xanthine dehydrogenase second molybdopterin binding domain-containing protein n=1 Tax=Hyalella azteca TaxID=294128 RepID=A0A6A0HA24_HYAAZ|nr:hypothetical protein HAZT_HAZT007513 [Hyalella azteca]